MQKRTLNNKSVGRYAAVKRGLDVICSAAALGVVCVPMLFIWLAIRIESKGGGIFRQLRVGRGGKTFVCYKFRTMHVSAPHDCPSSQLEGAEQYVTRVGAFLRRTSLDELPQLLNVLKGDMSLVGPRPLILSERVMHKGRTERGVYSLRPGITGLAQINGRNRLSDEKKLGLDTQYLAEIGFIEDVRIIGKTFFGVISGDGVKIGTDKK